VRNYFSLVWFNQYVCFLGVYVPEEVLNIKNFEHKMLEELSRDLDV